jgi:Ubiquitin-activating enzyme active site
MFGIKVAPEDTELSALVSALAAVNVAPFRPVDGLTIATTEEEAKNESKSAGASSSSSSSSSSSGLVDIDAQCEKMLRGLPPVTSLGGFEMKAISFEKDDDSHMR